MRPQGQFAGGEKPFARHLTPDLVTDTVVPRVKERLDCPSDLGDQELLGLVRQFNVLPLQKLEIRHQHDSCDRVMHSHA